LRENRATTSGATELTIVDNQGIPNVLEGNLTTETVLAHPQLPALPVSRINVSVDYPRAASRRKPVIVIVAVLIIAFISGVAFLLGRSRGAAAVPNANIATSPSPAVVEPSPLPSPSPSPKQEANKNSQRRKPDENNNENKESKVGRVIGKGKRLFKKIF
jgi:hypothetical protein